MHPMRAPIGPSEPQPCHSNLLIPRRKGPVVARRRGRYTHFGPPKAPRGTWEPKCTPNALKTLPGLSPDPSQSYFGSFLGPCFNHFGTPWGPSSTVFGAIGRHSDSGTEGHRDGATERQGDRERHSHTQTQRPEEQQRQRQSQTETRRDRHRDRERDRLRAKPQATSKKVNTLVD